MIDPVERQDIITSLTKAGQGVGILARDETIFRAAVDAFRAADGQSFQRLLGNLNIVECEDVCFWLRSKECVLECIEICGPPTAALTVDDVPKFAELVAKITGDEELIEQLADTIRDRDAKGFASLIKQLQAERYCHFLCHWACMIHWRLVCEVVCAPTPVPLPSFVGELAAAGAAVRAQLQDTTRFPALIKAAVAQDCQTLAGILGQGGNCSWICEWICSWYCILVCLPLCRVFTSVPSSLPDTFIAEMRAFAQAASQLANREGAIASLVDAVATQNAEAYAALLKAFQVERFCMQLCHWICFTICRRFCTCVCPPPSLFPQFTSIGVYDYDGVTPDINSSLGGNGLTIPDSRAFFNTLRLNGILTQTLGGLPMEYRFETQPTDAAGNPLGPWSPVLPAQIAQTLLGHWEHHIGVSPFIETKKYWVNHAGPLGPGDLAASITAAGWIQVPQENNFFAPSGAFSSNGDMIELITQSLDSRPHADETGVVAGSHAAFPLVPDVYFGIRMRVRQQGVPLSETDGGTCVHIAVDDVLYDNITLHPDWDGGLQPPGQLGVCMLDIAELEAHPCGQIGDTLTVLFTAAHPNLGSASITMTGPGGPFAFTMPAFTPADYFGTATPAFTVSALKPCAYLVTLQVNLLLTDGDNFPSPLFDQIAFCKS
ncbi:MAG TPA: hypothetical protein VK776_28165 [Bryobacteraceae bacterium]|nr:hypothetical protein [Bryobacteraceae bacterium]